MLRCYLLVGNLSYHNIFLLCFKNAIIQVLPLRQPSGQRHNFVASRLVSNLMLSVCLLGMTLVVSTVCNLK